MKMYGCVILALALGVIICAGWSHGNHDADGAAGAARLRITMHPASDRKVGPGIPGVTIDGELFHFGPPGAAPMSATSFEKAKDGKTWSATVQARRLGNEVCPMPLALLMTWGEVMDGVVGFYCECFVPVEFSVDQGRWSLFLIEREIEKEVALPAVIPVGKYHFTVKEKGPVTTTGHEG